MTALREDINVGDKGRDGGGREKESEWVREGEIQNEGERENGRGRWERKGDSYLGEGSY